MPVEPELANEPENNNQHNQENLERFYKRFEPKYAHQTNIAFHIKTQHETDCIKASKFKNSVSRTSYDFIRISDHNDYECDNSMTLLSTPEITHQFDDRIFRPTTQYGFTRYCLSMFLPMRLTTNQDVKTLTGEYNIDFDFLLNCEGFFEFMIYLYDLNYHHPDSKLIKLYHDFIVNCLYVNKRDNDSNNFPSNTINIDNFSDILFGLMYKDINSLREDFFRHRYSELYEFKKNPSNYIKEDINASTVFDYDADYRKSNEYRKCRTSFDRFYYNLFNRIQYKFEIDSHDGIGEKYYCNYERLFNDASALFENILKESNYRTIISDGKNPLKSESVIHNVEKMIENKTILCVINPRYTFIDWSNIKKFHDKHKNLINEYFHYILKSSHDIPDIMSQANRDYIRSMIFNGQANNLNGSDKMIFDFLDIYCELYQNASKNDNDTFIITGLKSSSAMNCGSMSKLMLNTGMYYDRGKLGKKQFEDHIPKFVIDAYSRNVENRSNEQRQRIERYYSYDSYTNKSYDSECKVCAKKILTSGFKRFNHMVVNIDPNKKIKLEELKQYMKSRDIDMKVNNKIHHTEIEQEHPFILNFTFDNIFYNSSNSNTGVEKVTYFFMLLSKYYHRTKFKFNSIDFELTSGRVDKNRTLKRWEYTTQYGEKLELRFNSTTNSSNTYFDVFNSSNMKPKINENKHLFETEHEKFVNLFEKLFVNTSDVYNFSVMVQTDSRKFLNMAKLGDIKPTYLKVNLENLDEIHEAAVNQQQI